MDRLIEIFETIVRYINNIIKILYVTLHAYLVIWAICKIIEHIYDKMPVAEIPITAIIIFLAEFYYSVFLWRKH